MEIIAQCFVGLIAVEHLYIMVLEMFLWATPIGKKTFGLSDEFSVASKSLAANQGVYNGFIAAGLIFGLFHSNKFIGTQFQWFFLACVFIAGIFGSVTAKKSIFWIQAFPALVTLAVKLIAIHT